MNRSRILFLARLALGLLLLAALLLWEGNGRKLLTILAGLRWEYVPVLLAFPFLLMGVSCLKWRLFIDSGPVRVPLLQLMGIYAIGFFVNNFLPSMVGGDVTRAYVLGRKIGSGAHSLASVFLERATGFLALIALCFTTLVFSPDLARDPMVVAGVLVMVGACIALFLLIAIPQPLAVLPRRLASHPRVVKLAEMIQSFRGGVLAVRDRPGRVALAMAYSVAFHLLSGLNVYLAGLAIGLEADLLKVIALSQIIFLVAALPITINGLGLLEAACSLYLVRAGASPEQGLAIALLIRLKTLGISVVGGLLFGAERSPKANLPSAPAPSDPPA